MAESSPEDAHGAQSEEAAAAGAAVLSSVFDAPLSLQIDRSFRQPGGRSIVLRCRVVGTGGAGVPESVIVKRFVADERGPYGLHDTAERGSRARLLGEWTGARFLARIAGDRPFGPAAYGGDGRLGLVVLEDLGEGACLADHLQGLDAARAEAALSAYAATLGRLHAATAAHEGQYAALRSELAAGGSEPAGWNLAGEWRNRSVPALRGACEILGLPISAACEADLETAARGIAGPGSFLAYSVRDTCPDNHRYIPGSGNEPGYLRFFDMEFGGFQHALLDAAYIWLPFPTCWCVNRLPEHLPPRLEEVYRAELVKGCPAAADDRAFHSALVEACAFWFVTTVAWDFARVLERDDGWGIATVRQRLPLRAENLARIAERYRHLEALGALAHDFADRVRARWPDLAEIPLYPAFRMAPTSGVSA